MIKHNFYDGDGLFEEFSKIRSNEVNFNDLVETPILLKMLPDLTGKSVIDIGCGMGQHAKQYAELGAKSVLGIDISYKMLSVAKEKYCLDNIEYKRLAMEDISEINDTYDIVTSSLVFDYVKDFDKLMADIYQIMHEGSEFIFSTSHPIVTSYDQTYPRWTRNKSDDKIYANLYQYFVEGEKQFPWGGDDIVTYHRTVASMINGIIKAGFTLVECQESLADAELRERYPEIFAGTIHRPDFIFFKCVKS